MNDEVARVLCDNARWIATQSTVDCNLPYGVLFFIVQNQQAAEKCDLALRIRAIST
jgi:hypothetical protein